MAMGVTVGIMGIMLILGGVYCYRMRRQRQAQHIQGNAVSRPAVYSTAVTNPVFQQPGMFFTDANTKNAHFDRNHTSEDAAPPGRASDYYAVVNTNNTANGGYEQPVPLESSPYHHYESVS